MVIFRVGASRAIGLTTQRHNWAYWFVFSLDSVIPVIQLDKDHEAVSFSDWRQYFLYFLRFLGAVLVVLILEFVKQSITGAK
jgi:hypothetical protein